MKNTSKVGVTVTNINTEKGYVTLNRNNALGGGGTITDIPTLVKWSTAYQSPYNNDFTYDYILDPVTQEITDRFVIINNTSQIPVEITFTTSLIGTSNRDVIFYLGNASGAPILEPRRFIKTSENQTITYHECNVLPSGDYYMWMYYDSATGSGTDISVDHPILTIKRLV